MRQLEFEKLYEFAFPLVYRFAVKRAADQEEAELLCRLILERAFYSVDDEAGRPALSSADAFGPWVFTIAKQVADEVKASPE